MRGISSLVPLLLSLDLESSSSAAALSRCLPAARGVLLHIHRKRGWELPLYGSDRVVCRAFCRSFIAILFGFSCGRVRCLRAPWPPLSGPLGPPRGPAGAAQGAVDAGTVPLASPASPLLASLALGALLAAAGSLWLSGGGGGSVRARASASEYMRRASRAQRVSGQY